MMLAGRGAEIGVRIADSQAEGVVIEEVQPDSPAEKAGLKPADVIVEFDGERVRSARQFGRLVQETPPGRTGESDNHAGRSEEGRPDYAVGGPSGRRLQRRRPCPRPSRGDLDDSVRQLGRLGNHLPPFNFNFDFDFPGALSGRRLGVSVGEFGDQLAQYLGAQGRSRHVGDRRLGGIARRAQGW